MAKASVKRNKSDLVSDKHWAVYAAAGAASALACQAAEAEIVYVTVNQTLDASPGPGVSSTFLPVGAGSTGQLFFEHRVNNSSSGAALFGNLASNGAFAGFSANGNPYAANLAYCQNISTTNFLVGTGTMAFNGGYSNSQFLSAGIGYLGFMFDFGAGTQYGWVRVNMLGASLNAFEIVDYAYCGVGESIGAGKAECVSTNVPEPGTLGLLAAGAVGLLSLRRRRQEIRVA